VEKVIYVAIATDSPVGTLAQAIVRAVTASWQLYQCVDEPEAVGRRGLIMGDSATPLMLRQRLRTELRNARQERQLTQEQVAKAMGWSLSKMIRIEKAQTGISANDLRALLKFYKIKDKKETAELAALAREARKQSWWSSYSSVAPSKLLELIDYEYAASSVRQFEPWFVPGILQTKEYARAVLKYYNAGRPKPELAALVDLRVRREDLLKREDAPQFSFILDESVVQRLVGGPSTMRRQLEHLLDVAKLPHVTIRVVPFSAGLHPGMKGPFEIINFADVTNEFIVFLEILRGDVISDDPEGTQNYLKAFESIKAVSLHELDSVARLDEASRRIA
jgi:transcriptional regulator with XRE-family HTH domain